MAHDLLGLFHELIALPTDLCVVWTQAEAFTYTAIQRNALTRLVATL